MPFLVKNSKDDYHQLQFAPDGSLKHLLTLQEIKREIYEQLFVQCQKNLDAIQKSTFSHTPLKGHTLVNLFFENSTRTSSSFALAAQNLGGRVINFNVQASSTTKGEALHDTINTLEQMSCDIFVIRHPSAGAPGFAVKNLCNLRSIVINAGDANHSHPTQGLLDLFTIQQHTKDWHNLSIAIVGDITHSRVARSLLIGLQTFGVPDIRLIGPYALLPKSFSNIPKIQTFTKLEEGIKNCKVIVCLRIQKERLESGYLPSQREYFDRYGLTAEKLLYADPNAIILHPGPFNRGVEIDSQIVNLPQSKIGQQVLNGVAMRMAVLEHICRN